MMPTVPTACRYTGTANSQTRIQSTYNLQSKIIEFEKKKEKKKINLPNKQNRYMSQPAKPGLYGRHPAITKLYWVTVLVVVTHTNIGLDIITVIKAHSGIGIKTVTCYTLFK